LKTVYNHCVKTRGLMASVKTLKPRMLRKYRHRNPAAVTNTTFKEKRNPIESPRKTTSCLHSLNPTAMIKIDTGSPTKRVVDLWFTIRSPVSFQARCKHVKIRNFENVLLLKGNSERFLYLVYLNMRFVCRFDAF